MMADWEEAFRNLEERPLEVVVEYQGALYRKFVAAREEVLARFRYAEGARRDLEEASALASELRESLKELSKETENAQGRADDVAESELKLERAAVTEDLARAEGLARAAEVLLSRPEFSFRGRAECEEQVSDLARAAVEESEKLRRAVEEAFERRARHTRGRPVKRPGLLRPDLLYSLIGSCGAWSPHRRAQLSPAR
jgi:hypothetical protein